MKFQSNPHKNIWTTNINYSFVKRENKIADFNVWRIGYQQPPAKKVYGEILPHETDIFDEEFCDSSYYLPGYEPAHFWERSWNVYPHETWQSLADCQPEEPEGKYQEVFDEYTKDLTNFEKLFVIELLMNLLNE